MIDKEELKKTITLLEPEVLEACLAWENLTGAFKVAIWLSVAISLKRVADAIDRRIS